VAGEEWVLRGGRNRRQGERSRPRASIYGDIQICTCITIGSYWLCGPVHPVPCPAFPEQDVGEGIAMRRRHDGLGGVILRTEGVRLKSGLQGEARVGRGSMARLKRSRWAEVHKAQPPNPFALGEYVSASAAGVSGGKYREVAQTKTPQEMGRFESHLIEAAD